MEQFNKHESVFPSYYIDNAVVLLMGVILAICGNIVGDMIGEAKFRLNPNAHFFTSLGFTATGGWLGVAVTSRIMNTILRLKNK